MFYYDPYKDRKFADIRGEKKDAYFRVYFDEASFYPTDDGYVLAGQFTSFVGVNRKFKTEEAIPTRLCSLTLYRKDYTIRKKNAATGKYEDVAQKASEAEKQMCAAIDGQKDQFTGEGLCFKGWLEHAPDSMNKGAQLDLFDVHKMTCWNLVPIPPSGQYPAWENTETRTGDGKGNGSYSRTISPEDKLTFVKKELVSCLNGDYETTESLATLVRAFKNENASEQVTYNDTLSLLKAVVS